MAYTGQNINSNINDWEKAAIAAMEKPYSYRVGNGELSDASIWNKFGYNADIDTASGEEIIGSFGGTFNIMTTADTLDVVSSSTEDDVGGTGAITLLLTGIDGSFAVIEEYVTMNGQTPVTTTSSFLGINRAVVVASGSNDANVGTITIDDTSNAVGTQAEIPIADSVTHQCIFHSPVSHNFLVDWLWLHATKLSGGSSPKVTIRGWSYSRVTDTSYEIFRTTIDTSVENTEQLNPSQPFVIGGREVLFFTAETDTNNTEVIARFSGVLIDNS